MQDRGLVEGLPGEAFFLELDLEVGADLLPDMRGDVLRFHVVVRRLQLLPQVDAAVVCVLNNDLRERGTRVSPRECVRVREEGAAGDLDMVEGATANVVPSCA